MALMALPSLTPLQASRTRELVEAMDAHDASKPSSGSSRRKKKRGGGEGSLRLLFLVVGVPVPFSDKFPQTWCPQCYCTEDRLVPSGTVSWAKSVAPVLCNDSCFCWCRKPVEFPQVQFLVKVMCPLLFCLMLFGQTSQKTADSPQLQSIAGRRHFPSFRRADPHGPDFSADHRDFPVCCTFSGGRCLRCAGRACHAALVSQWQFAPEAGYAGYDAPRLCSSWLLQAKFFLAVMDQKDSGSGVYYAGIACDNAPRAVFLGLQAHDARHHGRYGTRRTVKIWCPWSDCSNCGVSTVAVHRCRRHLCHGAQADSHGR